MEGHSHALSGAVTGAAAASYVLHLSLPQSAMLAGLTAGAAVLPDLDHKQATLAHCFGFLTKVFATLVGKISGGHRHGTHSLTGVGVFTALAWLAVHFRGGLGGRIGLYALLALVFAGGLYALRIGGHFADALAIAGAVVMVWTGYGLPLVAVATGLGCATHLVGDMLTDSGVPLLLPLTRYRFRLLPEPAAFTTGTRPEHWLIAPVLTVALVWLAWHAVMFPAVAR